VTIRPQFKKDSRPNNGLETIAEEMIADKQRVFYVVGTVKWAGGNLDEEGQLVPAAKFLAIEVVADGSQAEDRIKEILDAGRKERGLGRIEEQIVKAVGQMPGQMAFDLKRPPEADDEGEQAETRLGPDGEHEVPPPSGEEVVAELDERRAKNAKDAGVPAAEFSGGEA
jgi:hypothetical protein